MIYTCGDLTLDLDNLLAMDYDAGSRGVSFTFKSDTRRWVPLGRSQYLEIAQAWKQSRQAAGTTAE
jgi:hypothetical protein